MHTGPYCDSEEKASWQQLLHALFLCIGSDQPTDPHSCSVRRTWHTNWLDKGERHRPLFSWWCETIKINNVQSTIFDTYTTEWWPGNPLCCVCRTFTHSEGTDRWVWCLTNYSQQCQFRLLIRITWSHNTVALLRLNFSLFTWQQKMDTLM